MAQGEGETVGTRPVVEADLFEAARQWRLTRSPILIWSLLTISIALSAVSLVQAETADPPRWLQHAMLVVALAAAVGLLSAGTLVLHGSRENRWDAPVTAGLGSALLGVGTFDHALAAVTALRDVEPLTGVSHTLGFIRWVGLCLVVGGLVWRAETGWSFRLRLVLISLVIVAPLAAVTGWYSGGGDFTVVERGVLGGLAVILIATSVRLLRRNTGTPLFEGGTVLGIGLALAIVLDVSSVEPGDLASVASLSWLVVAGLLTALWFDRQAALRSVSRRSQTERYLRLIEDSRQTLEQAMDDRSILRHNGTSSLIAIEGGLDALGSSLNAGDLTAHERMTRSLAAEIARLRRMLASADANGMKPQTRLTEAVDSVVQLARIRGQLIAVDVPDGLHASARPDAVAEIIHNLLDNAAVHAPGALVAIEATSHENGAVQVVVQDDGPGVKDSLRATLFEKGVTQRKDPGGGLGLYSARQLALEAGGNLQLMPTTHGAGFLLTLPAAQARRIIDLRVVQSQPQQSLDAEVAR